MFGNFAELYVSPLTVEIYYVDKNKWGERLRPIISINIIKSNAKKMT